MSFKDKYTTADLITSDNSQEKKEKSKILISNDTMALGELLETLINTRVR